MKPAASSFCGCLLTLACSLAFAETQALVTIDPNNFAPGQNISNATLGARLLSFGAIPNPDPNSPDTLLPQYLPVYAQPVTAGCTFGNLIPCAPSGHLVLGSSSTTVPSSETTFWGEVNVAVFCLQEAAQFGFCEPGSLQNFPVLRVNFEVPTNYVTVTMGVFDEDPAEIEAFNSSGQSLGRCQIAPTVVIPAGCAALIVPFGIIGWGQLVISRPTADISFVLIGGEANIRPAATVQFNSPVPLQLAGLLRKSQGVGPGKSLELKALFAGVYYEVHDIRATCAVLDAYVQEVNAQKGKHLGALQALQLLGIAKPIEVAIGCH